MSSDSVLGALNQNQQPQTPQQNLNLDQIKQMAQFVKAAQNPELALQQVIKNNPQVAQLYDMISKSGKSPEELFYYLAKQKGVDPNQILNALR